MSSRSAVASEVLIKADADPRSLVTSILAGAHPGSTAAIGELVDKDLPIQIEGPHVCDACCRSPGPGAQPDHHGVGQAMGQGAGKLSAVEERRANGILSSMEVERGR